MEVIKHYCDSCGEEVLTEYDLIKAKFSLHFKREDQRVSDPTVGGCDICAKCLKEIGFEKIQPDSKEYREYRSRFWSSAKVADMFKCFARQLFSK